MFKDELEDTFDPFNFELDSVDREMDFCKALGQTFSFMPEGEDDQTPPLWLLKSSLEDEVVFYPGTFNPWHLGHRACLDLCPSSNIIVVPDFNPWKEGVERQRPWEHMKSLLSRLRETPYSIYPGFLSKEEGNPTVDWFPKVKIKKKGLLMGEDSFLSFHKWKEVERLILDISTLYIAPRGEDGEKVNQQMKRFPKLNIVLLDHHDYEGVSSTELRK